MEIIKFKHVQPGQEFVLPEKDDEYMNDIKLMVCVATNDGRAVSCWDGSIFPVCEDLGVVVEKELFNSDLDEILDED